MLIVNIGEFKHKMSYYLNLVKKGKQIGLIFGKKKIPTAILFPWKKNKKTLGLLKGKAEVKFSKDFKISDEEFLNS